MDLAAKSEMVEQVRAFVDWVGAGRKLTQTGASPWLTPGSW